MIDKSLIFKGYERAGKLLVAGLRASPKARARLSQKAGRGRMVEGRMLDDTIASLFAMDELLGGDDLRKFSLPVARQRLASGISIVDARGPSEVSVRDTRIAHMAARVYTPPAVREDAGARGVVYFHGGGFVACDLETHDGLCRRIAMGASCRVIAVEYRLAPEYPFPTPTDDALVAFRHIVANAKDFGVDPNKLAIAGDSAGGNICAVLSEKTKSDDVKPAYAALLYPAVDATNSQRSHKTFARGYSLTAEMLGWYYGNYFGNDPVKAKNPDVSPLLREGEGFAGMPKTLVFTAGFDPLRDEGDEYAKRVRAAGGVVVHKSFDAMPHGFCMMTEVPAAKRACDEVIAIMRDAW